MSKYFYNSVELLIFLQYHPYNNDNIVIPVKMRTEYVAPDPECKSNSNYTYISVDDVIKMNSYRYYYDFEKDNVIYSCYEPKFLKYPNGNIY